MSGSRAWQVGGVALLGGVGYYMYQAGGDPKAAQKRVEADAAKVAGGKDKEVQKSVEVSAADMGAKVDQYTKEAKDFTNKADAKLDQYRRDASKELDKAAKNTEGTLNKAVDQFDKSVTEGASKAKSGISSWFGGK